MQKMRLAYYGHFRMKKTGAVMSAKFLRQSLQRHDLLNGVENPPKMMYAH